MNIVNVIKIKINLILKEKRMQHVNNKISEYYTPNIPPIGLVGNNETLSQNIWLLFVQLEIIGIAKY